MASVTIEVAPALDPDATRLALDLGPADVAAPDSLVAMVGDVGLSVVVDEDWSEDLRATVGKLLVELEARGGAIGSAEGEGVYEEDLAKKRRLLEGLEQGVLRRTLVVATSPG